MKKEVILVPKDECPLDVLAEMGERIKEAWIFLHSNVVDKLKHSDGVCISEGRNRGNLFLLWKATEDHPETEIIVNIEISSEWKPVQVIKASDIAFRVMPGDPEDIFFLKMAE